MREPMVIIFNFRAAAREGRMPVSRTGYLETLYPEISCTRYHRCIWYSPNPEDTIDLPDSTWDRQSP